MDFLCELGTEIFLKLSMYLSCLPKVTQEGREEEGMGFQAHYRTALSSLERIGISSLKKKYWSEEISFDVPIHLIC